MGRRAVGGGGIENGEAGEIVAHDELARWCGEGTAIGIVAVGSAKGLECGIAGALTIELTGGDNPQSALPIGRDMDDIVNLLSARIGLRELCRARVDATDAEAFGAHPNGMALSIVAKAVDHVRFQVGVARVIEVKLVAVVVVEARFRGNP